MQIKFFVAKDKGIGGALYFFESHHYLTTQNIEERLKRGSLRTSCGPEIILITKDIKMRFELMTKEISTETSSNWWRTYISF